MTMDARVSVIIPAYNRANLIEQTLASVAAQSLPVSEIVVVDDGSRDATSDVVSAWFNREKAINGRLRTLPQNVGKPLAVNVALSESRGEFVIILDSDDILLSGALARQVSFLRAHEECGLVFGLAFEMHGQTMTQVVTGGFGMDLECGDVVKQTGDFVLRVNPIVSSSVMIRRSAYTAVGGMVPDLRFTHDWEYWTRISRRFPVGFVPTPLAYYRMDTTNSSSADRLGTFREVCFLLSLESERFPRTVLIRSLIRHMQFNATLALKEGKVSQSMGIALRCLGTGLKLIFS